MAQWINCSRLWFSLNLESIMSLSPPDAHGKCTLLPLVSRG